MEARTNHDPLLQLEIDRLTQLVDEMEPFYLSLKGSTNKKRILKIKKDVHEVKGTPQEKLDQIVDILETAFNTAAKAYSKYRFWTRLSSFIKRLKKIDDRKFHYPRMLSLMLKGHYERRKKLQLNERTEMHSKVKDIKIPRQYWDNSCFMENEFPSPFKPNTNNTNIDNATVKRSQAFASLTPKENDKKPHSSVKIEKKSTHQSDHVSLQEKNASPVTTVKEAPKSQPSNLSNQYNLQTVNEVKPAPEVPITSSDITKWYIHVINNIINQNNALRNGTSTIKIDAFEKLNNGSKNGPYKILGFYQILMLLPHDFLNNFAALRMLDQFERRLKLAINSLKENAQLDYYSLVRILIPCITTASKLEEESAVWNLDFVNEFGNHIGALIFAKSFNPLVSALRTNVKDLNPYSTNKSVINKLEDEHLKMLQFDIDLPINLQQCNNRILELLSSMSNTNVFSAMQNELILNQLEKNHSFEYERNFFLKLRNFVTKISAPERKVQDPYISAKISELIRLCDNAEANFNDILTNIANHKMVLNNDEIDSKFDAAIKKIDTLVSHSKESINSQIKDLVYSQIKSDSFQNSTNYFFNELQKLTSDLFDFSKKGIFTKYISKLIKLCNATQECFDDLLKETLKTKAMPLSAEEQEAVIAEIGSIMTNCKGSMGKIITKIFKHSKSAANISQLTGIGFFNNQDPVIVNQILLRLSEFTNKNHLTLNGVDMTFAPQKGIEAPCIPSPN